MTPLSSHLGLARSEPPAEGEALRILYIGDDTPGTNCRLRSLTLERLGHHVTVVNPAHFCPSSKYGAAADYRTGYRLTRRWVQHRVDQELGSRTFDLAWVGGGAQVSPALVRDLKERAGFVVNYNNDDPHSSRDGRRWDTFRTAIPEYDLLLVLREPNVQESYAAGARAVRRVWMTYDETVHQPAAATAADEVRWASDVLFVGTYMPERGPLMAELIDRGVPLTIYGSRWEKAPEWPIIQRAWKGPPVYGADYAKALQYAKVCLGLLSKGNRDLHTRRSVEVPAIGSLLCAERTSEHLELFREGEEAVYWGGAEECAVVCQDLLDDAERRTAIAAAGHRRVLELGLSNESLMSSAVELAMRMGAGKPTDDVALPGQALSSGVNT